MKGLLRKNLIAHKERNKLTSIIYSLTLACVMFLVTSLNLQIASIEMMDGVEFDYDLRVLNMISSTSNNGALDPLIADPIL
jgi:hypothetical protein